jgi:hypothetical protein
MLASAKNKSKDPAPPAAKAPDAPIPLQRGG